MITLKVSKWLRQIVFGANIATVAAMMICGYSYLIDTEKFPLTGILGLIFPAFIVANILFMLFWTFIRWRNIWLSFAGFMVCYTPVSMYIGMNRSTELPDGCLKVMSYNVLNYSGLPDAEVKRDSNAIVLYIAEQDCDIVCLQESSINSLDPKMRAIIDNMYPYRHEEYKRDNPQSILSKYEITNIDSIPYPSVGNYSMAYTLNTPHGELLVINNHLESNRFSAEDKEQFGNMMHGKMNKHEMKEETRGVASKLVQAIRKRAPEAKAVAQFVEANKDKKIILCGDFNEWPVSFTHNIIAKNLTDCFIATGQGLGWSFTHHGMRVRIDNIMCSKTITPYSCHVDSNIRHSDHFPIICWLKID